MKRFLVLCLAVLLSVQVWGQSSSPQDVKDLKAIILELEEINKRQASRINLLEETDKEKTLRINLLEETVKEQKSLLLKQKISLISNTIGGVTLGFGIGYFIGDIK